MQISNEILRVGKSSLWLIVTRIGTQVLALVTLLLARKLGSVGFGEFAFFTTVIFVANVVTTCGTDLYFIREIAAHDDLSGLPAALWLQMIFSGLFIVGTCLFAPLLPNQSAQAVLALQIYSLALLPLAFYSVFTTLLRGKQRMDWYAQFNLSGALIQTILVLFFLLDQHNGVVFLAIVLLASQLFLAGGAFRFLLTRFPTFAQGWRFSGRRVWAVFVSSASLGLLGLVGMVYQKAGVLLLAMLSGAALTGLFASALRVVEAAKVFHIAALTVLYPLMAQEETQQTLQFSWKLLLLGGFGLALGLSLLAVPLVDILYGSEFAPAIPTLRILAWTLVPYSVNAYLTLAFVARRRTRLVVGALTVSLIGLAALSLWWIPVYGLEGAAWAALAAETLQAMLLLALVHRFRRFTQNLKSGDNNLFGL